MAEPIIRHVRIDAAPEAVFEYFVDPTKITRWLATEATHDPRPGGICHQLHVDDEGNRYRMRGEFVEIVPPERVVFTWGFLDDGVGLPPGSTTVEVTLVPDGAGTIVHLAHRDLPASQVASHSEGWTAMLDRLAVAAKEAA